MTMGWFATRDSDKGGCADGRAEVRVHRGGDQRREPDLSGPLLKVRRAPLALG